MDPITQGALGAAVSQSGFGRSMALKAALFGWLAGMAADLDTLLAGPSDPVAYFQIHRGFTHSLVFIPIGGLLVLLPFLLKRKNRADWKRLYAASTLGYATHGLLDACTPYGTLLFWPFSNSRVAWDNVSIVDPLFTLPLILAIGLTIKLQKKLPVLLGIAFGLFYLGFGVVQNHRGLDFQKQLAASRGHTITKPRMLPTVGNLIVWRSIYEHQGRFYYDKVRVSLNGKIHFLPGTSSKVYQISDLPEGTELERKTWTKAFQTYHWFAQGYLALNNGNAFEIADIRYSDKPGSQLSLWTLHLSKTPPTLRLEFLIPTRDQLKATFQELWKDIKSANHFQSGQPGFSASTGPALLKHSSLGRSPSVK